MTCRLRALGASLGLTVIGHVVVSDGGARLVE
jgi:hypothetical protein